MAEKSKKELILTDSIVGIVAATVIDVMYPPFGIIATAMKAICIGSMAWVALTHSKYDKVFKNCKLNVGQAVPILKSKTDKDYSIIYHFTLPAGLSEHDFHQKEEAIQNYIGKEINIGYGFKEIIIEEYKNEMKRFYEYEPIKLTGRVPILIGYDRKEELISCDLSDGEPHLLIAGQTGGGKSTAIRCIITNLIVTTNVKLHLIDLKNGVELRLFADSSHVLTFSRNMSQAQAVLQQINMEVDRRYDLFYKEHAKDINEYNHRHPYNGMDYQVLVVDEFADFQSEKAALSILEELGRKARACGIHMILSTQRPDAKIINGTIKANIPTVLGLKSMNEVNSRIIIDENGLEKLHGKGHGLFKREGKITEIQVPFVSPEVVNKMIKYTFVKKENITQKNNEFIEVKTL